MSEASDLQTQQAQALQQSVWDPALGKNVYTDNPAQYVRDHWDRYKDYTGAIMGGSITKEALLGLPAPQQNVAPPSYDTQYQAGQGYAQLHPDEVAPKAPLEKVKGAAADKAKIVPGAAPNVGVLPDGTVINLIDFSPMKDVDPVTAQYAKLAAKNPNTPKWVDVRNQVDINGRGYQYGGQPSAEEQALQTRFLAGDMQAAGPLAQARMKRLQVTPKPGIDAIMKPLTLAMIAAGLSAAGGAAGSAAFGPLIGGALGGATGSGLTNLAATNGDWQQALIGAGSGLAGGLAGGATNALAGGGIPGGIAGGAAGGVAGSGAKAGLTSAFGGQVNPWDIAISGAAGAGAGGLTSALNAGQTTTTQGSDPGGIGDFTITNPPSQWARFLNSVAGKSVGATIGQIGNAITPGDPTHLDPREPASPFPSQDTMQAYRNAETDRARAELQARLDEYNAARDAAMQARDSKLGEYNQKMSEYNKKLADYNAARDAALARLHQQAVSYLQQVQASMKTPFPVTSIPLPQGSPTPPPPDPFDPSAALGEQTFAGDFPVTGQSVQQASSNPAPETVAAASKAVPKTDIKRLPLNIMQIQAALARRR